MHILQLVFVVSAHELLCWFSVEVDCVSCLSTGSFLGWDQVAAASVGIGQDPCVPHRIVGVALIISLVYVADSSFAIDYCDQAKEGSAT